MTDLTVAHIHTLPALIDRAAGALTGARNSAEVLEARDMARVAYDAAKTAGRMARAKQAHDAVIAAVYRAQADAAVIEARAKVRLADEYDAAQERAEVATRQHNPGSGGHVPVGNMPPATAADLGLRRKEIHEARKLRDAETAEPGRIQAAADALVARGEEPTKAALRREVIGSIAPGADTQSPDEKARRELAKLTPEALIDEVIGLRAAVAGERAKRKAEEARATELQEQIDALTAAGDMGAKLGKALETLAQAKGRLAETQASLARERRRANLLEAERDKLKREREGQMIDLGAA